ncbi:MAG: hypothetical protein R3E31_05505 [Chloroflexota bacterium]
MSSTLARRSCTDMTAVYSPPQHHSQRTVQGLLADIFSTTKLCLMMTFSLYLHMPSMTDPTIAPDGHEAFYVLSPVPHLGAGIDWTKAAKPYRDAIMQFLEDNYLPDLQDNIVAEHYIDPLHFQNTLNSYMGSAFSVEPVLTQSAWFRPHNRSEDFDNLYFVGAGGASWRRLARRAFFIENHGKVDLYRAASSSFAVNGER